MTSHSSSIFKINTGTTEPIYRQLMEQIRRMCAAGYLRDGDLLPSVREVAQGLALNPMTVSKAYNYLETEGLLQRHRGIGMLVRTTNFKDQQVNQCDLLLRPILERAAQEAEQLGMQPRQTLTLFKKILKENK